MKEMSLCRLVDTDYPFLSVCAPTYSVESFISLSLQCHLLILIY